MKLKKIHLATLGIIAITSCGSCQKEEPVCLYGPAPTKDQPEPIRLLYGVQPRDAELRNIPGETPGENAPESDAPAQPKFNPDEKAADWEYLQSLIPEEGAEED